MSILIWWELDQFLDRMKFCSTAVPRKRLRPQIKANNPFPWLQCTFLARGGGRGWSKVLLNTAFSCALFIKDHNLFSRAKLKTVMYACHLIWELNLFSLVFRSKRDLEASFNFCTEKLSVNVLYVLVGSCHFNMEVSKEIFSWYSVIIFYHNICCPLHFTLFLQFWLLCWIQR